MERSTPSRTCDAHVDTPWVVTKYNLWGEGLDELHYSMLDLEKLRRGGLDSAVFVMYLPDYWYDRGFDEGTLARQAKWALAQASDDFTVYLALEGWRTDRVSREFIERVKPKYVTLVHAASNALAESCTDLTGGGLTQQGREAVYWLQDQGILVDLSHSSMRTCLDVLEMSRAPVIASHSGARSVLDHPRNLTDRVIKGIAKTGGWIGVPLVKNFVGDATGFCQHVNHMLGLVGADHIGIGSDMDGATLIDGLRSAADWTDVIVEELDGRLGLPVDTIEGICGENFLKLIEPN